MLGTISVGRDAHIAPSPVLLSEYGLLVQKYIDNIGDVYNDVLVDKYVIMPNHIHMIIILQNGTLKNVLVQKNENTQGNGAMRASRPTEGTPIPTIIRSMKHW